MRRAASRAAIAAAALAIAALVAVAALHTRMGHSLSARLGGCPVASGKVSAEQRDRARKLASAGSHGAPRAPARPAFGFALDVTTLGDVHAWARSEGLDCDDSGAGLVKCAHVPGPQGIVDELVMAFDGRDRLVNVTTFRTHLDPDTAAATARGIAASLAGALGPPTTSAGAFDGADLATPGLAGLATVSYRFSDYAADVTAMNLARSGPSIREHYMSGE